MTNSSDPADRIRAMTDDQRRSFLMWLAGDRPELPAWLELWQASLQRLADRQAPPMTGAEALDAARTDDDFAATVSGILDVIAAAADKDAARADASAAVAAAEVPDELAEHRVVIRLDGGDYELSCTGCSLRGLAPTLRAAVKTKRDHEGSHR